MNSKRSKRIRQLVKHLMHKGAVEQADWSFYVPQTTYTKLDSTVKVSKYHAKDKVETRTTTVTAGKHPATGIQVFLDPKCGRAIYQQMKKQNLSHKAR